MPARRKVRSRVRRPDIGQGIVLALLTLASPACAPVAGPASGTALPECATRSDGFVRSTLTIAAQDNRQVEFIIFHPERPGSYPLVAFSSGAFSDPDRYERILGPVASWGAIVVAPIPADAEKLKRTPPPAPQLVWDTRVADMNMALHPSPKLMSALEKRGLNTGGGTAAMGHSYGGLIAQIAGGARTRGPNGALTQWSGPTPDAVIAWSPPGALPDRVSAKSFTGLAIPTMTITGTADILPGFIDDWKAHLFSYDHTKPGARTLWIGDGIDHYFGGVFGRERQTDEKADRQFDLALADLRGFLGDHVSGFGPCQPPEPNELRTIRRDV